MTRRPTPRAECGISLVECVAAIALAGLVLASITQASRASAAVLRGARAASGILDVTRSLLEVELGAPCGPRPSCPPGHSCSVSRHPLSATVDRIVVEVALEDGSTREQLATLAPALACPGG